MKPITDDEISAAVILIENGWSFARAVRVLKRDDQAMMLRVRRRHVERMEDRKLRRITV